MPHLLIILALALASTHAVAQEFNPTDLFGDDWAALKDGRGRLTLPLRDGPLPACIDVGTTGEGEAVRPVASSTEGTLVTPADSRGSVELALDLGASSATASVQVVHLEVGGIVAWRVHGLGDDPAAYLAELVRTESSYLIRVRTRTRVRFVQVPGALEALGSDAPPSLTVTFNATELSIGAGGKTMATEASLPDGAMIALAVSDAPATVHSLVIDAKPADKWAADAAVRVTARRALARLRDFAAAGLLAGLQGRYPDAQKALADYSTAQSQQRARAANLPPLDRATELMAIADALPENGLAAYEGGLAALMAGATEHGHSLLKRAAELSSSHAARLALAEAQRRMGLREQAARTLADCKESLPDDLRPELALLEARLMADRGELGDARARLEAASAKHPAHQQLAAFTESARLLTQRTDMAAASVPGPLGLRLLSDMPDDRLRALVRRLKPYVQQFRTWLPQLPEGLRGNVVLFSGPVEYLNAALLVAGDNLDNIAGMFIPQGMQGMPTVMATRAFGEDELLRTLVHELWHLCLRAVPPGEAIPRWIDEGMAVMLSAGRAGANGLRFDCLPEEFAGVQDFAAVAADGANLAAALKATPVEFYQAGPVRAHYAAAWAAVWHLAGDQARAADLRRALAGDEKATKALAEQVPRQAEAIGKAIAALK